MNSVITGAALEADRETARSAVVRSVKGALCRGVV
jgi:hypothetical protein